MRRKDRQMGQEFAYNLIDSSTYGTLSMNDVEGHPYGIPLSMAREGEYLYFHSAQGGKKVESLAKQTHVSVCFVGEVEVPDLFTQQELEEIREDESKHSQLTRKVFTTEFESVIILGKISILTEDLEKIKGLKLICEKYTPSKMTYFDLAIQSGLSRTNVYRIKMDTITAKRKKYALDGEEIKGNIEE